MLAPILGTFLVVQQVPCAPDAMRLLSEASVRASRFNLPAAVDSLRDAANCESAIVAAWYLQGLLDARAAASVGGTAESLAPVRKAIAVLEELGAQWIRTARDRATGSPRRGGCGPDGA